jgi:ABC-type lipoprotein export system ATPase subunit
MSASTSSISILTADSLAVLSGESIQDGSIQLKKVVKQFKNTAGEFTVLKGIDLDICTGEFVSIVGKSGSGKSTLLNMITGIDRPTGGDVLVAGTNLHRLSESQRALWRGKHLGIVFQFFQLLPMLSLLENTMLPMDYTNTHAPVDRPRIALDLLRLVGLEKQADKLPAAVSSGQQQSAAIARALATNPPIIVADEPTGNLDSRSAEMVIQLFERLVESGKTILLVTHDPTITTRTKRTVIISDGELIDETVARALPLLNHRQMLDVTRLIERRTLRPGEDVIQAGSQVAHFYMVASGAVEVLVSSRRFPEQSAAILGPGEFFGEIELMRGGNSLATIRAAQDGPAELLVLPRAEFLRMLSGSPLTEEAIAKIVQHRLAENQALSKKVR